MATKYETTDLYLAAALQCRGHVLACVRRNGRQAHFVMDRTGELEADVQSYFARRLLVDALEFANTVKACKAAVFNT